MIDLISKSVDVEVMNIFKHILLFLSICILTVKALPCRRSADFREPSLEERIFAAKEVFVGTVTKQLDISDPTGGAMYQLDFRVDRRLKGKAPVAIRINVKNSTCDPFGQFAVAGSSCLVFLDQKRQYLGGAFCSSTGKKFTPEEIKQFEQKAVAATKMQPAKKNQDSTTQTTKTAPPPTTSVNQEPSFLKTLEYVKVPKDWQSSIADFCRKQEAQYVPLAGLRCDQIPVIFEESYGSFSVIACENKTADPKKFVVWDSIACGTENKRKQLLQNQKDSNNHVQPSLESSSQLTESTKDEAECKSKGGIWGDVKGRGRIFGCNLPTQDAGKVCRDSKECESACVHQKCYGWKEFRGCGMIVKGQVLCVD